MLVSHGNDNRPTTSDAHYLARSRQHIVQRGGVGPDEGVVRGAVDGAMVVERGRGVLVEAGVQPVLLRRQQNAGALDGADADPRARRCEGCARPGLLVEQRLERFPELGVADGPADGLAPRPLQELRRQPVEERRARLAAGARQRKRVQVDVELADP